MPTFLFYVTEYPEVIFMIDGVRTLSYYILFHSSWGKECKYGICTERHLGNKGAENRYFSKYLSLSQVGLLLSGLVC